MRDQNYWLRGAAVTSVAAMLLLSIVGCAKKDDTLTAAPPTAAGAKAPPPTNFKQPRPKLPPLVGKDGKKTGGLSGI